MKWWFYLVIPSLFSGVFEVDFPTSKIKNEEYKNEEFRTFHHGEGLTPLPSTSIPILEHIPIPKTDEEINIIPLYNESEKNTHTINKI